MRATQQPPILSTLGLSQPPHYISPFSVTMILNDLRRRPFTPDTPRLRSPCFSLAAHSRPGWLFLSAFGHMTPALASGFGIALLGCAAQESSGIIGNHAWCCVCWWWIVMLACGNHRSLVWILRFSVAVQIRRVLCSEYISLLRRYYIWIHLIRPRAPKQP